MHIERNSQELDEATLVDQIKLLADLDRIEACRAAVEALVKPGDVVAEIECGCGVMGRLALDAGAEKVVALDRSSGAIALAQFITSASHPESGASYQTFDPRDAVFSEKVDVVLTPALVWLDTIESLAQDLFTFAAANLRAGGAVCPRQIELRASLARWTRGPSLVDNSSDASTGRQWTDLGPLYFIEHDRRSIVDVGPAQTIHVVDPLADEPRSAAWQLPCDGARPDADAIVLWIRHELAPGIAIENGPDNLHALRGCAIVPIPGALQPGAPQAPRSLRLEFAPSPSPGRVTVMPGGAANIQV